ncbi:beta-ketoacyl synthase N-terminal-like domain-containing protein [Haliangium sp.]|uniref:beta-ketoacyl synthase N-terminal-like domain-containing protein n=1 Tax=Haliangium sp. TaxID=2663208 RepID=UPI003D149286
MTRVAIVGAGVICARGLSWRGLSGPVDAPAYPAARALASSHPGTAAAEVPAVPAPANAAEARARKLMSRSALLAAVATGAALDDAGWGDDRDLIGMYLGVGASGGSMEQLEAMLAAAVEDGALSAARFGDAGLRACSPLFAFQLMNNFTLCHGAIQHGVGGPNAAVYSRGSGTVLALDEAAHAVATGACTRALAGGADSALHPVTWDELVRQGGAALIPGEAAAILALTQDPADPAVLAFVDGCRVCPGGGVRLDPGHPSEIGPEQAVGSAPGSVPGSVPGSIDVEPLPGRFDSVVLMPSGPRAEAELRAWARARLPEVPVVDAAAGLGETLAAGPALAWLVALDRLTENPAQRALVVSAGVDGDLAMVALAGRAT